MNLRTLLLVSAALIALLAGIGIAVLGQQRPSVEALWLKQPRPLVEVTLQDQLREPFGQAQLQGKWTLLFIGYTSCPDICPTTMADLARLYPKLAMDNLQVVMLSADPVRDTPDRLDEYIYHFEPSFKGVTGEHSQLYPFTQSLGLVYALVDSPTGGDYLVDHSADIVLINPQGQLEAIFRPQDLGPGQLRTVSMAQIERELPKIVDYQS
ncbi:SCO family protein [Ferrimonas senticii]|uniref:SCO family protein n=1 Tax=Ferrimonas senticii TaxID=394566 RepID=UPI00040E5608|nr:SCO family protein [Ferrimonas senticii]